MHIRKGHLPAVVYVDFLSMYSTVNTLMGLGSFVIVSEIRVTEALQKSGRSFSSKTHSGHALRAGNVPEVFLRKMRLTLENWV